MGKSKLDAPKRIYLQHDPENTGEPFNAAHEVTWSADRINNTDIEYIRADIARSQIRQLTDQRDTAYGYGSDDGAPPWIMP